MNIVITSLNNNYQETVPLKNLDNIDEDFKKYSSIKEPIEAKFFALNNSISSLQLSKLRNVLDKMNIYSLSIYSSNRDTILAGKSLKIESTFKRRSS